MHFARETEKVICSCGGEFKVVSTTEDEEEEYGCSRRKECCVRAMECNKCETRITFNLKAPDPGW